MRPTVEMILADSDVTLANPKTKHACSGIFFPLFYSFFHSLSNTFMREHTHTHTELDPWDV